MHVWLVEVGRYRKRSMKSCHILLTHLPTPPPYNVLWNLNTDSKFFQTVCQRLQTSDFSHYVLVKHDRHLHGANMLIGISLLSSDTNKDPSYSYTSHSWLDKLSVVSVFDFQSEKHWNCWQFSFQLFQLNAFFHFKDRTELCFISVTPEMFFTRSGKMIIDIHTFICFSRCKSSSKKCVWEMW